MNRKMVFYMIGKIVLAEAAMLLLPLVVALLYKETPLPFLITIGIALVLGIALSLIFKPKNRVIYAKEGFVIVAFAWIALSLIGCIPFVLSGALPNFFDAFFETVSGFTTTGASVMTDVESMPHGVLMWRSFTHWVGGMGVLVFIMAIIPSVTDRSIHILRAEMPGPIVGKLVPRAKQTARILYLIYVFLTAVEVILLVCGKMPLFDALVHSFGTAGTGGFGIKADSIGSYSTYCQVVITIFMLVFGVNFNLYFLALLRNFRSLFKSQELWCYLSIFGVATALITANIYNLYHSVGKALQLSTFQVASILTTTGFSTADFDLWPDLSRSILFLLMFVGGCAGSTAGGLKVSRVMLLFKLIRRELRHMLHPRSVGVVKLEGKRVDNATLNGVSAYFPIYFAFIAGIFLILSLEPNFNIESNLSATVSCFNNIGPGLGLVGPVQSYTGYSNLSKFVLSMAMLLGRLEIFPLWFALSPSTWSKK